MKVFFIFLLTAPMFVSVGCSTQPEGLRVDKEGKRAASYPMFGEPIDARQSFSYGPAYLLIPFWMYTPQKQHLMDTLDFSSGGYFQSESSGASVSMSYSFGQYNGASVHWNNVIFIDKQNGKSHLLLNHPAVICHAFLPSIQNRSASGLMPLLFAIAEKDTNDDGYINDQDAVLLYAAQPDGTNLVRLTPADTQFSGIVGDGSDPAIAYVRLLTDSKHDHRFIEGEDHAVILRVDLKHPSEGTPVLDDAIQKQAEETVRRK